jgi:hypothetical protein
MSVLSYCNYKNAFIINNCEQIILPSFVHYGDDFCFVDLHKFQNPMKKFDFGLFKS